MLQVAAYCRVSTDKEDQANSFEAQQRYFHDYIERQPSMPTRASPEHLLESVWSSIKCCTRRKWGKSI